MRFSVYYYYYSKTWNNMFWGGVKTIEEANNEKQQNKYKMYIILYKSRKVYNKYIKSNIKQDMT